MSSGDGEDKRMVPVRSIFLRPDQYRKHWDAITPTKRSAHIRDRLDTADQYGHLMDRYIRVCGLVQEGIESVMGDIDLDPVALKGWARRMERELGKAEAEYGNE
jgi:hypothetical protein